MKRVQEIKLPDNNSILKSKEKWNSIAKPLHSLGLLEDIIIKISGILGDENFILDKKATVVMCGDNGVVDEGVTQSECIITKVIADEIANNNSNINLMGNAFNVNTFAVDVGMKNNSDSNNIINKKISYGTKNMTKGPAMTKDEAKNSIIVGMDMVKALKKKNYKIIVTGEMGIGNTTTSSAIASILLNEDIESVTGRGAGLNDEGLKRKISAIKRAIKVNNPDKNDPIDILSKIGGYDIGGMTGLFLGGAYYKIPIVIDGFISSVAAYLAYMINPMSKEYMIASHVSKETAGKKILDLLGLEPIIYGKLCLGEGTGGVLIIPLIESALNVYNSTHKFEELEMEKYEEFK